VGRAGGERRAARVHHGRVLARHRRPAGRKRYAGTTRILEERGTLARVAVCPPGRSRQPEARPVTMWIDLASPEHCDAGTASLTAIGTRDAPKEGALS